MFPIHLIVPGVFLCIAAVLAAIAGVQAARGHGVSPRAYVRAAIIFFVVAVTLFVRFGIK
jgi:hypothetical protein